MNQIRALAAALDRLLTWQERQMALKEKRRIAAMMKKEQPFMKWAA